MRAKGLSLNLFSCPSSFLLPPPAPVRLLLPFFPPSTKRGENSTIAAAVLPPPPNLSFFPPLPSLPPPSPFMPVLTTSHLCMKEGGDPPPSYRIALHSYFFWEGRAVMHRFNEIFGRDLFSPSSLFFLCSRRGRAERRKRRRVRKIDHSLLQ